MSRTQPEARLSFSSPGKVFILGEYAVLAGLPAALAAVGPRFQLITGSASDSHELQTLEQIFHSESPAGKLVQWLKANAPEKLPSHASFHDPHSGAGGFGASTAQFALLLRATQGPVSWQRAWELYRELTESGPSGADLVAQWRGSALLFNPANQASRDLSREIASLRMLVFSATGIAGRKIATHDHLRTIGDPRDFAGNDISKPLMLGIEALQRADARGLGKAMQQYANALSDRGLENLAAREDREAIQRLKGVVGVKGAGAMLSDALIVLCEPGISLTDSDEIVALAETRGLKMVQGNAGFPEKGIRQDS